MKSVKRPYLLCPRRRTKSRCRPTHCRSNRSCSWGSKGARRRRRSWSALCKHTPGNTSKRTQCNL